MTRTPVFFIGHGSPMNAIQENDFTHALNRMRDYCPHPKAILCISAHWMTEGSWVTQMEHPKTIHDFYGFPKALFDVTYPAPGSREIADLICKTIPSIHPDKEAWGLDHGSWSVLRHVYPAADIPVLQLSLYLSQGAEYHYQLGQALRPLREQGVLIVGSGNVVHNLRTIDFRDNAPALEWAVEYDRWIAEQISTRNYQKLITDFTKTQSGKLSVPTPEHYLPLLYALGASDEKDKLHYQFEGIQNGSISMRTIVLGDHLP